MVSAVGHEIDFTISDFVADVRAATPSAAAEIITEGLFASRQFVAGTINWMWQRIRARLARKRDELTSLLARMARAHPRRRLNEKLQRLDDLQAGLARAVKYRWREWQVRWQNAQQALARVRPAQLLARRRQSLRELERRLRERLLQRLTGYQNQLAAVQTRLRLLSPANILDRGYSITRDAATGEVVRDATLVSHGQRLKTRLKNGEISSVVEGQG